MSEELKNILNNSNKDIDNQKLMDYLSQQLSKQESHDVEMTMANDEFMNDAIEGLEQFSSKKSMSISVEQLNRDLKKQLAKKEKRKEKRRLKDQPWIYYTIILLLALLILCYIIIKKHADNIRLNAPVQITTVIAKPNYTRR